MNGIKPMLVVILVLNLVSTVFSALNYFQQRGVLGLGVKQESLRISPYGAPLSKSASVPLQGMPGSAKAKKDDVVALGQTPVPNAPSDELKLGEAAPMFRMQDVNGKWMSLADFKYSKNVVLMAWLQTCPHCLKFLPKFKKFYEQVKGNKKVQVITVTRAFLPEEEAKLKEMLKANGYNFTVLLSSDASFGQDYKLRGVPTVWVIDTNLKVRGLFKGSQLEVDNLKGLLLKPLGM